MWLMTSKLLHLVDREGNRRGAHPPTPYFLYQNVEVNLSVTKVPISYYPLYGKHGNRRPSPPVLPPGESLWVYTPHWSHPCLGDYGQIWRHPQNRKCITYALSSVEDRATATGNTYRKFREVRISCFWGHASGHTYRHVFRNKDSDMGVCSQIADRKLQR